MCALVESLLTPPLSFPPAAPIGIHLRTLKNDKMPPIWAFFLIYNKLLIGEIHSRPRVMKSRRAWFNPAPAVRRSLDRAGTSGAWPAQLDTWLALWPDRLGS